MAMRPCTVCGKNEWTFDLRPSDYANAPDKTLCLAACKTPGCPGKAEFIIDKPFKEYHEYHADEPCKRCQTPIVFKESNSKTVTAYYICPKCKAVYHDKKFKK